MSKADNSFIFDFGDDDFIVGKIQEDQKYRPQILYFSDECVVVKIGEFIYKGEILKENLTYYSIDLDKNTIVGSLNLNNNCIKKINQKILFKQVINY
jgi:hypothetical protein